MCRTGVGGDLHPLFNEAKRNSRHASTTLFCDSSKEVVS